MTITVGDLFVPLTLFALFDLSSSSNLVIGTLDLLPIFVFSVWFHNAIWTVHCRCTNVDGSFLVHSLDHSPGLLGDIQCRDELSGI